MCQPLPGPRCAAHVRPQREAAREGLDAAVGRIFGRLAGGAGMDDPELGRLTEAKARFSSDVMRLDDEWDETTTGRRELAGLARDARRAGDGAGAVRFDARSAAGGARFDAKMVLLAGVRARKKKPVDVPSPDLGRRFTAGEVEALQGAGSSHGGYRHGDWHADPDSGYELRRMAVADLMVPVRETVDLLARVEHQTESSRRRDRSVVHGLAQRYRKGEPVNPAVVHVDGAGRPDVLDGTHRVQAAGKGGREFLDVLVSLGPRRPSRR